MLKKSEGTADREEKLKLLGQSLSFASEEAMAPILRLRSEIHREVGEERKALADLAMILNKSAEDQSRVQQIAERLGLDPCEVGEEGGEGRDQEEEEEEVVGEKHKHLKLFSSKVNIRKEAGRGRFVKTEQRLKLKLGLSAGSWWLGKTSGPGSCWLGRPPTLECWTGSLWAATAVSASFQSEQSTPAPPAPLPGSVPPPV